MRSWLTGCLLLFGLTFPASAGTGQLPGVWFLDGGGDTPDYKRLVVGGSDQGPPESSEQVCLGWSWRDPRPDVELYPDAAAGAFLEPEATWVLTASGATSSPESCRPADASGAPLRFAFGPADELWLLAPPDVPARRSGWADLFDAVEAAYRQSTPSPLAAQTIGALERCAVRSLPVALDTRLDRWLPVELPDRARHERAAGDQNELIRTRRFLWWIEPATPGESCAAQDGPGTLRLFPVPSVDAGAVDAGDAGSPSHFLTVTGLQWRRLRHFALDPDDWSPRTRRQLVAVAASGEAPAAGREIAIRPSPEQRQMLLEGRAFDLCQIEGFAELCARNARARRQLYTAIPGRNAENPWPEPHRRKTREACQAVLGDLVAEPDACTATGLWQRPIAGELVAGFTGEMRIARHPGIRETWREDGVEWRLETGDDSRDALPLPHSIELRLLDGDVVQVDTRDLLGSSGRMTPGQRWALLVGALAVLGVLLAVLAARRSGSSSARTLVGSRAKLERLIEGVVDRRLQALGRGGVPAAAGSAPGVSDEQLTGRLGELVGEAIDLRLRGADDDSAARTADNEQRLGRRAQELDAELRQTCATLVEELRGSLRHEAQSLIQGLRQDFEAHASPFHRLRRELAELSVEERERLAAALEAMGLLGDWIEHLWPVLRGVVGLDVASIPRHLPEPAAAEWRAAARTLRAFTGSDAVALSGLARGISGPAVNGPPPDPSEVAFLEKAGLLSCDRPVAQRLKRYLEPFDHPGRLSEVTLALQYLIEAYPIEQLSKDERPRLRQGLSESLQGAGLVEDFHHLVAQVAAGVGLRYRAVRYYKSRTDQNEYAFVRHQVSPLSLSERVGFEATTERETIVRLERPFFFQLSTDIYYAGHAHVARR